VQISSFIFKDNNKVLLILLHQEQEAVKKAIKQLIKR
jgi:hypothetical protein